MTARGPYYVDKDTWVAQLVGGTTGYGNGSGTMVMLGPIPQLGGGADFKSRGMFQIAAADVAAFLASATAVVDAYVDVYVGNQTCTTFGAFTRLLLEAMTTDFSSNSQTGCNLSSSTAADGRWAQSNNVTTTNSAFYTGNSLTTNTRIRFDITAIMAARLAANDMSALRFRLIASNDAMTYDETGASHRISVWSSEYATDTTKRPQLSGDITIGNVSKPLTGETGTGTEGFSVSQTGTSPVLPETGTAVDGFTGGPAAGWSTDFDTQNNGHAFLYLPAASAQGEAMLTAVSATDVQVRCMAQLDKVPLGGNVSFMLMVRGTDPNNCYRVRMSVGGQLHDMSIVLEKVVAGVVTALQYVTNIRAFLAATDYWLKVQAQGTNPTTLNAKLWRWGDAEPGWVLNIDDSEASLQSAGAVGMGGRVSSTVTNVPITIEIDQFEAYAP